MLYNPKWLDETKPVTKPDVFSLESLIAWLEKQPANKAYDYENCEGKCLYGLYAASYGIAWKASGGAGAHYPGSSVERSRFCDLVYATTANPFPWTFGAALARARSALSSPERAEL